MGYTIATHNGSSCSREHNRRNEKCITKDNHIDFSRPHEVWHDESHKSAYNRIFGKTIADYNKNQKRADRHITDYYNTILNHETKHPVYEMIIGVYGGVDEQTGKSIMRKFVDTWKERNPNLELIGAYYHADEEGEPHCHIDYVPVAHGYKRGMETQNSIVKALQEQGYEYQNIHNTEQIQWEHSENAYLEQLCNEHGIEIEHPMIENINHLDTEVYKKTKSLESAIDNYNKITQLAQQSADRAERAAESELNALERIEKLEVDKNNLQAKINVLRGEYDAEHASAIKSCGKSILGKIKPDITIPYSEYKSLHARASAVDNIIEQQRQIDAEREKVEQMRKMAEAGKQTLEQMTNQVLSRKRQIDMQQQQIELKQQRMDEQINDAVVRWTRTHGINGKSFHDMNREYQQQKSKNKFYHGDIDR